MTAFGFAYLSLCVLCGYAVWRGSRRLWNAILGGLAIPLAGVIAFGALIGREELEALAPVWLIVGTVAGIAALALAFKR